VTGRGREVLLGTWKLGQALGRGHKRGRAGKGGERERGEVSVTRGGNLGG